MTSYLPAMTDWQVNLLGSDEAGAYLSRRLSQAGSDAKALAMLKAFLMESCSCLGHTVQDMGVGNPVLHRDLMACVKVLKDDCAEKKHLFSMESDDNAAARKLRPAHFMAFYEKHPSMAEEDWVTFQMLGDFARVHQQAATGLVAYFQRLESVERASCPGRDQEEKALSARLVEIRDTLSGNAAMDDTSTCFVACREIAETYEPAHGAVGVMRAVQKVIHTAFNAYEANLASGRKNLPYPNPFGLKLTPEIRAEDRSTIDCLRDFFQPSRLASERRNRMRMAIVRSPEVLEGICMAVSVLYDMGDKAHGELAADCEKTVARMAEIAARGNRFAALANEDADVVEVRMTALDETLSNRSNGMRNPEAAKGPSGQRIHYSRLRQ